MVSIKLLLFCCVFQQLFALKWDDQYNDSIYAVDCDFRGNDFGKPVHSASTECGPTCLSTPGCTHFTWYKEQCYLKNGDVRFAQATGKSGAVCGISKNYLDLKIKWNECAHSVYAVNCDFKGNDFKVESVSPQQCGSNCLSTPSCTHFTWYEGNCYLKKGEMTRNFAKFKATALCGISKKIQWSDQYNDSVFARNCYFKGHYFTAKNVPAQKCGPACQSTVGCTHFTWHNDVCYLQMGDADLNQAARAAVGSVCGISKNYLDRKIQWNECAHSVYAMNCDLKGNDFKVINVPLAECGPNCLSSPSCTHFSWFEEKCYLKKGQVTRDEGKFKLGAVCGVAKNSDEIKLNDPRSCLLQGQESKPPQLQHKSLKEIATTRSSSERFEMPFDLVESSTSVVTKESSSSSSVAQLEGSSSSTSVVPEEHPSSTPIVLEHSTIHPNNKISTSKPEISKR